MPERNSGGSSPDVEGLRARGGGGSRERPPVTVYPQNECVFGRRRGWWWINNGLSHCRGEISDWKTAYSTYWRPDDKNVSVLHHAGDQPAATFVPAMRSFLSVRSLAAFPFSSTLSSGSLAGNVPPDPVRGNVQVQAHGGGSSSCSPSDLGELHRVTLATPSAAGMAGLHQPCPASDPPAAPDGHWACGGEWRVL